MNFTKAKYISFLGNNQASITAELDGKKVCIPINSDNRHYKAIQEWVAKGNKIEDAD
tara:strand:+ start:332 stop:502 length:171 start_codon:yes stop_codon:yes gene_type:complete